MNPLTQIPDHLRVIFYWGGYVLGVLAQGITVVWGAISAASTDIEMPIWLVITSAVVGLLQTQLNLLAGSNIHSTGYDPDVVEFEA